MGAARRPGNGVNGRSHRAANRAGARPGRRKVLESEGNRGFRAMAGEPPPNPPDAWRTARGGGRKARESAASRLGRNGGHRAPRRRARRETRVPAVC